MAGPIGQCVDSSASPIRLWHLRFRGLQQRALEWRFWGVWGFCARFIPSFDSQGFPLPASRRVGSVLWRCFVWGPFPRERAVEQPWPHKSICKWVVKCLICLLLKFLIVPPVPAARCETSSWEGGVWSPFLLCWGNTLDWEDLNSRVRWMLLVKTGEVLLVVWWI